MEHASVSNVTSQFSERRTGRRLRFDPSRAAILVVDMLNEFLEPGGEMVLLEGRSVIEPINRLLAASREMGMRVVWLCDEHPIPEAAPGTRGSSTPWTSRRMSSGSPSGATVDSLAPTWTCVYVNGESSRSW